MSRSRPGTRPGIRPRTGPGPGLRVLVPHRSWTRANPRSPTRPLPGRRLTLVLVRVLGPRCYWCPRDHHGRQVDFLVAGHVTCPNSSSFVSSFSAFFSFASAALGSLPQPGMSIPVSVPVPGLGLLTQPSSLPLFFCYCGSILPSHVPLVFVPHCRPYSSSASGWEGSAHSSSPLRPGRSGRRVFPCPHTCV